MTESMRGKASQDAPVRGSRGNSAKVKKDTRAGASTKSATARSKLSRKSSAKSSTAKKKNLSANGVPQSAPNEAIKFGDLLGQIVSLMALSPFHKYSFISDLDWLVAPALLLGQFEMWEDVGVPVAYISWAKVNLDIEKRFSAGGVKLMPSEWNSGTLPWIVDVICPGRDPKPFLQEIVKKHFQESGVKTIAPDANGQRRIVMLQVSKETGRQEA